MLPSATLLTLPQKREPLTTRFGLAMGQTPVFPFPTLAGRRGETRQNKRRSNETAIKHLDLADSWFFVVRADHPGRTDSINKWAS
jgi:hypothetical protein